MLRSVTHRHLATLRFFVGLIVLLLVQFTLLRAGLMWRTWTPNAATTAQLALAFLIGLRFDLATACFIAAPATAVCYVPWIAPWRGPRQRWWYLWTLTVIVGLLSFLLLCEYEFFREFQSRFNQLAIRYWDHPETVGGMVWYNYPVLRYVAAGLLAATAFHLGLRLVLRWAYPVTPTAEPAELAEPAAAPTPASAVWPGRLIDLGVAGVIVAAIVFGARGGFQREPLRWGDAFRGDSEFANQMSLNGIYSLAKAVSDVATRGGAAAHLPGEVATHGVDDEAALLRAARRTVQSMIVAPGEKLLDPDNRTALRVGDPGSRVVLKTASGRPVNVVMVLMESFSARFVGACGAPKSFTPRFDAIAHAGTLFDRNFSAGTHTHQGVFASQLGFPNLPGYESLMESGVGNQEFLSAAEIFHERGYHTLFLYNGQFDWDNMKGFFRKQGVETFIGAPEMEPQAKYVDKVWGVSDGDVFDRANREFDAAAKKGPFFATILTLSNHIPFQVPVVPGLLPITDQGDMNGRLTAMNYADYCVGQFIEDAKKLDYFKDTLFVFVGDHGFHVPPVLTELQLLYHHVPMVYYAPGLVRADGQPGDGLAGVVDHRVATHMNMIPSIMGLLGISDTPQSAWARSLFNDTFPDHNFAVIKNTGGAAAVGLLRDDKLMIVYSAGGHPLLFSYTIGDTPAVTALDDPQLQAKMEAQVRAYVRAGLDDLTHHHAGPAEPGPVAAQASN